MSYARKIRISGSIAQCATREADADIRTSGSGSIAGRKSLVGLMPTFTGRNLPKLLQNFSS